MAYDADLRLRSAIVASIAIVALSCTRSPPANERLQHSASPDGRIAFADAGLRDQLGLGPLALARDDAQLLHVTLPVRSTTGLAQDINWRITWLDANGIPLGPPTPWSTAAVTTDDFRQILATSWTPRATDARLELRYAK
ncbi:MAG TPA: DUF1425 domain-containing protein [Tepidisphaeraceae bacterium]|nr:DUF1425 domain-containing protein [Tepidisphaeraceae bacterium]